MVKIIGVEAHSYADKASILPGDMLSAINGHMIADVLDYRFYLAEKEVELSLVRDGCEYTVVIKKHMYDDIGLDFESALMDNKQRCENKCIFCFIDQNPCGMRESIYFKDDDSRLSFLHGNYITLTNLSERDIDRIIEMHISPVNISVHTTNPELRVKMMKNKRSGEVLHYIKKLCDAGIKLRGQIVLCRNVNDGEELKRTMTELYEYYPCLDSVSIVPAGLTGHRDGLYPLTPFTLEECRSVIRLVDEYGKMCMESLGERVFYCSDEFYLKAELPIPEYDYYGEFSQIENGVGMIASFENEFNMALKTLSEEEKNISVCASVATGEAAYAMMLRIKDKLLSACPNVRLNVYAVKNEFFGGEVTVTGLLTGKDIAGQLEGRELGDMLCLSKNVLRSEGDLFLCGMKHEELSKILNIPLCFTDNDGAEFLYSLLGIEI